MKLARHFYNGKILGKVTAEWTMGHLYLSQGLEKEAELAFGEARSSNNFTKRIFNHGRRVFEAGRLGEAKHAFQEALTRSSQRSKSYLAGMRSSLADQYFRAGYFQEALAHGEAAVAHDDELPEIHFQVAASYLAIGRVGRSRGLFSLAIDRFGRHRSGSGYLKLLIDSGVREPEAREFLKFFYSVSSR